VIAQLNGERNIMMDAPFLSATIVKQIGDTET